MSEIFSSKNKYTIWRKLWVALAKGQKELGLPITDKQLKAMSLKVEAIDFELVAKYETKMRHDVMAHIHAFADACPEAKGILHLGATSAFVTDNGDLIQIRSALNLLKAKSIHLLKLLKEKSSEFSAVPCLSYTHLQPAQPTTVGKRIALWMQDFLLDTEDLIQREQELAFLGLKGATGTQSSFMTLFNQDGSKVEKLDAFVANEMGFSNLLLIAGQTYTRKQDQRVLSALEGLAATSHKCATDLRLLAHLKEMGEEKGETQVGSSAMPHKQNPILSERVCGLSRFLLSLCQNPAYTLATQWLERSLDDSSNRRIVIPEAFLSADAILNLLIDLFSHLQISREIIEKNLQDQLPLLSLENILMLATARGEDRQDVHALLRENPLQGRALANKLGLTPEDIETCFQPNVGRAKDQVRKFIEEKIDPLLDKYRDLKFTHHSISV